MKIGMKVQNNIAKKLANLLSTVNHFSQMSKIAEALSFTYFV